MKEAGIYIHIPFCIRKCKYCDFVSLENAYFLKEEYINSVIKEMELYKGEKADTIYIGGGTPTSLDAFLLERLLGAVYKNFDIAKDAEVTIECNPKTADTEYFKRLLNSGANRLSIGIQSLCDEELKFLGRIHTADEAKKAVNDAREAGFLNISTDVMFALSCQTMTSLKQTLDGIFSLAPEHISCYSLMIEEGTPFFDEGVLPVDDDTERDMYDFITDELKKFGYERYEISNFAKDNKVSRHNIKYWERTPYIGLGAAAHSHFGGRRFENTQDIKEYIKNPFLKQNEILLTKSDEMSEFMFLGLRMTDGVSFARFKKFFGKEIEEVFSIKKHIDGGFLEKNGDRLFFTKRGIEVSNAVLADFI